MHRRAPRGALEVEDDDVVRLERAAAVANVHPDAIDKVVAVRLDDESLVSSCSLLDEQGSERCLRARVEVDLRLLKQEGLSLRRREGVDKDGEHLTDAVAHVAQVERIPIDGNEELERIACLLAEALHLELGEEIGILAIARELPGEILELVWARAVERGELHGNVGALGFSISRFGL